MRAVNVLAAAAVVVGAGCRDPGETPARTEPQTIRVAVVGGLVETGLWPELAQRYQLLTGHTVQLAASGPKHQVIAAYRKGGIDLITVHASDAMIELVADGLAIDPQPWLRNDLVIVGPADDPAKIRGQTDALAALRAIVDAKAPLLVHASHGADGVLHDLREAAPGTRLALDPAATVLFSDDNQHGVLARAAAARAYTIVGRIPFVSGKLRGDGIELMVRGDPRLRRPYLVEIAPRANDATRDLATWLRAPETQQWIAGFGKGKYDDQPLFFPVTVTGR